MKKYIFILSFVFILFSCKGAGGHINPHEKRTLTVKNDTSAPIDITVKARYNSIEYFKGTLVNGKSLILKDVPLCTPVPEQSYEWRISKLNEDDDDPVWYIRPVTDDEKIKVTVSNNLSPKKPKLICKIKGMGDKYITEVNFNTAPSPCIAYLHDAEYDFSLEGAKLYYKKKADGSYDESQTYFGLNDGGAGPKWNDENQSPVFFTIVYDTAAKTIAITPN